MTQTPAKLSAMYVYPVKSLGGMPVSSWRVDERGLELDRRWMVVDKDNKFLTQRQIPRLALISVSLEKDQLVLNAPRSGRIEIPSKPTGKARIPVQVWKDEVQALPADLDVSNWISDYLGQQSNLVYMPDDSKRYVQTPYAINRDPYGFADAFPFLILSEGSLEELNRRLEKALPVNRFRPNLVLSGCEPFAEDGWKEIRIGQIVFRVAKPDSRCATTTVDQSTAEVGKEPLKTLSTFRKKD
ncbi:MAG: MOSC N-terminal beta barrel domain-containing protein, partial [Bacteroidota bacterium]